MGAIGLRPYVVQHLRGAIADYQTGHTAVSKRTIRAHW
jgi:hypothetical protein